MKAYNLPIEFTGERVVPWSADMMQWPHVLAHHLARYTFAVEQVPGRRVFDVGCGSGYGSFLLSFIASQVTGIDASAGAIQFARTYFGHAPARLSFDVWKAEDVTNHPNFDAAQVVTCFEVLEHLDDPSPVIEAARFKTFIWSVPVNDPGRFHRRVYSAEQAAALVPGSTLYAQDDDGGLTFGIHHAPPKYVVGIRGPEKAPFAG